jgi:tetratricopeptide (TPR) repeat protein
MTQLRRILAEFDPLAEYVETVPRLGYRLCLPVLPDNPVHAVNGNPATPISVQPATPRTVGARRPLLWSTAAALLVLAIVSGSWGWNRYRRLSEADRASKEGQRLRRLRGDPSALRGSIENFRKATELDPSNASYFAELAAALSAVPYAGRTEWSAARDAAERGFRIDSNCSGCRAVLGFLLFSRFWDWDGAGTHLREALRLSPESSGLHGYMAMYLSSQVRLEEALKHADEAVRLDPYFARISPQDTPSGPRCCSSCAAIRNHGPRRTARCP